MRSLLLLFVFMLPFSLFGQTDTAAKAEKPAADKYKMIERNRNASLFVFINEIQQDDKVIGTFQENISKDKKTKTLFIYILNGPRVAEATCEGDDCHTWSIVTKKDKANHSVISKQGSDRKDIVSYLIRTFYL